MKRHATLRDFSHKPEDTVRTRLGKVAIDLHRSPLSGKLQIRVVADDDAADIDTDGAASGPHTEFVLDLDTPTVDECEVESSPTSDTAAFVMYVREDALSRILSGEVSPIEALDRGQLRYCGDESLGVAIFRTLAQTQNAVFEPCQA